MATENNKSVKTKSQVLVNFDDPQISLIYCFIGYRFRIVDGTNEKIWSCNESALFAMELNQSSACLD